jgi:hypothetical protein
MNPAFLSDLRAALPANALLVEAEALRPYECDGLSAYRQVPLAVCLPETLEQAQAVLRVCREHRVPVVARGAGTGLSGGALPLADGVVLSLARFNRILEIDPDNRLARVQPGVRNLAISEAAARHGLYYAPDPVLPDRLFHRRQRGGKLRRRALPEIRSDRAQRAGVEGADHGRRVAGHRPVWRWTAPATTCWR